jgi:amino acid adenylation domain-containing protein
MKTPVQVISDDLPSCRTTDLSALAPDDEEVSLANILRHEQERPLDYDTGSPVHALLVKRPFIGAQHVLVLTLPPLCADAWSLRQIVQDLTRLYAGDAASAEEPLQYLQFSEWQNEILEADDEDAEAARAYWRKTVADLPPAPRLAFEAEPADPGPVQFANREIRLNAPARARLHAWCRQERVSPDAALAVCWQTLMGTFSARTELTLRVTVDGRKFEDLHNAVGLFASCLPCRASFDAGESFLQAVQRTDRALQEIVGAQEYYWREQADLPESATSEMGVGFTYEDARFPQIPDGEDVKLLQIVCPLEPLKLALICRDRSDRLDLEFAYDARRYPEPGIRQLAHSFLVLLDHALATPDAPIGSLPLLTHHEQEQLLNEFNPAPRELSSVQAVHSLFEQHAHAHPDALALVCEDETLTYQQLNARANQIAHRLLQHGVTPDTLVALCLPRGAQLIVGLLGILKAGAAYLPLDPALPKPRLNDLLKDSEANLLVSTETLAADLDAPTCLLLDRDASLLAQEPQHNPEAAVRGEHLAYVIYTSGSTGKPKGVGIEHRNLLNYVLGVGERLGLGVGASYAHVSTLAADLGHTTLFGALCLGGCLHLLSSERVMDPTAWRDYFARHQIDCLKIVPSHLRALLGSESGAGHAFGAGMLPQQVLVLGGEACPWELVQQVRSLSPSLRVLNHYGPTETTVGVLTYEVGAGANRASVGSSTVPLGRPLANSRIYVLNGSGVMVPVGVVGEICIGGRGVGRGYLKRPELTSERFVEDGFAPEAGSRMYRSGDQGRYLSDGNVEFLGRVDDQVKIRGYRIELGEIQSALSGEAGVRECVVVAREEAGGEKRLVGYVVSSEVGVSGAGLRASLRSRLPEYLVPSSIVVLPRLPLTSNGKVDRKALPAPEEAEALSVVVVARNPVESVLVEIWEELLGRAGIGVTQSFFELGGHSLLATQVISRVRETFQVEVPLRALFDANTIEAFAEQLLLDPETRPQIESMAEVLLSLSELSEEELEERLSALEIDGAEV